MTWQRVFFRLWVVLTFFLNSGRPMLVREFLVVLALTILVVMLLAVILLHGCDLIGNAPLSPAFG
jgi:hypothetical protein